ncbi:uncharacterized protein RJT20DRAFT_128183 [Scheffersomyces xylosifermentans]|uniref:uncharacterized protein n=1 Tax=Scheffersomyces xylosifermentans TaxID=1304137 RepID=UPI00315C5EFA
MLGILILLFLFHHFLFTIYYLLYKNIPIMLLSPTRYSIHRSLSYTGTNHTNYAPTGNAKTSSSFHFFWYHCFSPHTFCTLALLLNSAHFGSFQLISALLTHFAQIRTTLLSINSHFACFTSTHTSYSHTHTLYSHHHTLFS